MKRRFGFSGGRGRRWGEEENRQVLLMADCLPKNGAGLDDDITGRSLLRLATCLPEDGGGLGHGVLGGKLL